MGFSRQEYWSGVPLPSPSITAAESIGSQVKGKDAPKGVPSFLLLEPQANPWGQCLQKGLLASLWKGHFGVQWELCSSSL